MPKLLSDIQETHNGISITHPADKMTLDQFCSFLDGHQATWPGGLMTRPGGLVTRPGVLVTRPGGPVTSPAGLVTRWPGQVAWLPGQVAWWPGQEARWPGDQARWPGGLVNRPGGLVAWLLGQVPTIPWLFLKSRRFSDWENVFFTTKKKKFNSLDYPFLGLEK